jgi:quinoprotein glucose dehydrogenase
MISLNKKHYRIYVIASIIIILTIITAYYRYNLIFNFYSNIVGYERHEAHKLALIISDKPLQYLNFKLYNLLNKFTIFGIESQVNMALNVRNNFSNIRNALSHSKISEKETDNFSDTKDSIVPVFQWTRHLNSKMMIESKPQLCGGKLIYTIPEGTIGALNYKTGEDFWTKTYKDHSPFSRRGLTCKYNAAINVNVLYIPTSQGVLCLNSENGDATKSICGDGFIRSHKTLVPPIIHKDNIYIATISPAGIAAHDINNGKLLWRTDFEVGYNFFLEGGSNPWSGFTFDSKTNLIFVNTGSPSNWANYAKIDSKYKYSNSLIALDAESGDIAWQFKENSHDYWDLDLVSAPIISPVKVNNKEIIITFSKSGSIYFLDINSGESVFEIIERKLKIGDLSYSIKESITPKQLLSTSVFNKKCRNCYQNTKFEGFIPPLLKKIRMSDGSSGGVQWPGGTIDSKQKLLIVPSNRNIILEHYYDFVPEPKRLISSNKVFAECFKCHSKTGGVISDKKLIYPSLFLTSRIYSTDSLREYIKSNKFHKDINISESVIQSIHDIILDYDNNILSEKSYTVWQNHTIHNPLDTNLSSSAPFGLITAISLKSGKIIWQKYAGTFKNETDETILGSPNYGGISSSINKSVSVFTGSYDKLVYGIDNRNGNKLWKLSLPASGSAPPYVFEKDNETWIFIISSGGRTPGDKSDELIAFLQSENSVDQINKINNSQIHKALSDTKIKKNRVELYNENCAVCHGLEGIGTNQGPSLLDDIYSSRKLSDEAFLKAIQNGVLQLNWQFGPMPPQHQVSKKEANSIMSYVRTLQNL